MNATMTTLRATFRVMTGSLALMIPLHAGAADAGAATPGPEGSAGRVLRLESCGPEPSRALLAALEQIHAAPGGVIEIRALAAGAPACPQRSGMAGSPGRPELSMPDGGYLATDARGRSIIP